MSAPVSEQAVALLVFVFDPLALILILAAEQTIVWAREERENRKGWHQEWVPDTENPWHDEPAYELDDGPLTNEQIEQIKEESEVDQSIDSPTKLWNDRVDEKNAEEFFARGKEIARAIDDNDGFIVKQHHNPAEVNPVDLELAEEYALATAGGPGKQKESILDKHPYLTKKWTWPKRTSNAGLVPKPEPIVITRFTNPESNPDVIADIPVLENEETWAQRVIDENSVALTTADADNAEKQPKETNASFGTKFPANPIKGDLFLRVDSLPNKLYKWNGQKWIEVDRNTNDRYAYEKEYIKFLTDKVRTGEYQLDHLTKPEQDEVFKHLDYATRSNIR